MITPVILCGGSGTRLWPLSRKSFPKQFANLLGQESLFQLTAQRFSRTGFADPVLITGHDFRFIVTEQLDDIGITASGTFIEPEGRNTAPAAIAAALLLHRQNPDAMLLLTPSDHTVADPAAFCAAVERGCGAAETGQIVTFGITPSRAETGYGWLEVGAERQDGAYHLNRFIEKPDSARAKALFAEENTLWNAGVFLTRADTLIEAFQAHAADILETVTKAVETVEKDMYFTRIDPDLWARVPEQSIDYAVMEKADNISAVRFDGQWSDLGSWEAVWQEVPKDANGNALSKNATSFACENTLLRSDSNEIELVAIGLKDVVAIAMRDAVLLANMSDSQHVQKAVTVLKERGAKQAQHFPLDHRPWGWFETLVLSDRFQVKRIHVHPGAALSLQSHHHRAEHWIVVAGTAQVTIDDEITLVSENQSIYVPLAAKHRLENPGKVPVVLIEVQTGGYLGEDDIIRYEDLYARGQGAKG